MYLLWFWFYDSQVKTALINFQGAFHSSELAGHTSSVTSRLPLSIRTIIQPEWQVQRDKKSVERWWKKRGIVTKAMFLLLVFNSCTSTRRRTRKSNEELCFCLHHNGFPIVFFIPIYAPVYFTNKLWTLTIIMTIISSALVCFHPRRPRGR